MMQAVTLNNSVQVPRIAKYLGNEITSFYKNKWKEHARHIALLYPFPYEYLLNDPRAEELIMYLTDQADIQVDIFFYPEEHLAEQLLANSLGFHSLWYQKPINDFDAVVLFNRNPVTDYRFKKLFEYTGIDLEETMMFQFPGKKVQTDSSLYGMEIDNPDLIVAYTLHGKMDLSDEDVLKKYESGIWTYRSWKKSVKPIVPLVNIYPAFSDLNLMIEGWLSALCTPPMLQEIDNDIGNGVISWDMSVFSAPFWCWLKDEMYFNHDPAVVGKYNPLLISLMEKSRQHFIQFLAQYIIPVIYPPESSVEQDNFWKEVTQLVGNGLRKLAVIVPVVHDKAQADFTTLRKRLSKIPGIDHPYVLAIPEIIHAEWIREFIRLNEKFVTLNGLEETLENLDRQFRNAFDGTKMTAEWTRKIHLNYVSGAETNVENSTTITYGREVRRIKSKSNAIRRIIRVKYTRTGVSRFYTHRDIIRILDKFSKKAGAPLVYSQGKLPRPRISFGPPLAMGYESLAEYADFTVETARETSLKNMLNPILPEGIKIVDEEIITGKIPSLSSSILINIYQIDGLSEITEKSIKEFLAQRTVKVKRNKEDMIFEFDIRPHIKDMRLENASLILEVRAIDGKMARVQEIIEALCTHAGINIPELKVVRLEQFILTDSNNYVDPIGYIRKMKV